MRAGRTARGPRRRDRLNGFAENDSIRAGRAPQLNGGPAPTPISFQPIEMTGFDATGPSPSKQHGQFDLSRKRTTSTPNHRGSPIEARRHDLPPVLRSTPAVMPCCSPQWRHHAHSFFCRRRPRCLRVSSRRRLRVLVTTPSTNTCRSTISSAEDKKPPLAGALPLSSRTVAPRNPSERIQSRPLGTADEHEHWITPFLVLHTINVARSRRASIGREKKNVAALRR